MHCFILVKASLGTTLSFCKQTIFVNSGEMQCEDEMSFSIDID